MRIRAKEHLAIGLEVDVQHVVRLRHPRMCWLNLDGLTEHLHRSLPYILGLPLYSDHLAVLIEQEHGWVCRIHRSVGELSLEFLRVYGVDPHTPGTLRVRNAWALRGVPGGLYLLWGKPFILLAQLSNLLGRIYRLSGAALRHRHTGH